MEKFVIVIAAVLAAVGVDITLASRISPDSNADIDFADIIELNAADHDNSPIALGRGINDATAVVGSVFRLRIPNKAFHGSPKKFSVKGRNGGALPLWLSFNEEAGVFEGVPLNEDVGHYLLRVKAMDSHGISKAHDDFAVEVIPRMYQAKSTGESCPSGSDLTIASVVLDRDPTKTDGVTRVSIVRGFSMYFTVDAEKVDLMALPGADVEATFESGDTIRSGPGNIPARKHQKTAFTLQWLVGCDGNIWASAERELKEVASAAHGGLLATILMNTGIIGWHVSVFAPNFRSRRQVGSGFAPGTSDQEPEEENDPYLWSSSKDNEIPDEELLPAGRPSVIVAPSPVFNQPDSPSTLVPDLRELPDIEPSSSVEPPIVTPILRSYVPMSTPVRVPVKPTLVIDPDSLDDLYTIPDDIMTVVLSTVSASPKDADLDEEFEEKIEPSTTANADPIVSSSIVTGPLDVDNEIDGMIEPTVTMPSPSTMPPTTPSTPSIDEIVPEKKKNRPPALNQRLAKQAVMAGSVFKIAIPDDTFEDFEQGNTRSLRLILKMEDGTALGPDSWIQFEPQPQILYGLAAEKDIGRWKFILEAMDNEGDVVTDMIEIIVRQDSQSRVINHEFSIQLRLRKKYADKFANDVDSKIAIVEKLSDIFGDMDAKNIVVPSVTNMAGGPTEGLTLTWRNNSLPMHTCPEEDILKLLNVLTVNKEGELQRTVKDAFLPEFDGKRAWVDFKGSCAASSPPVDRPTVKPPSGPEKFNHKPVVHQPIDQIVAHFGKLLRYTVPEETFFDEEDGNTRNLNLELKTSQDFGPVPAENWLQFDSNNQEFYGLPMESDPRRQVYTLKCTDSRDDFVNEVLEVVVKSRPFERVNVEFSITIDARFEEFVVNAGAKALFVRKIAELFGDADTKHISVKSIDAGSVIVTWYNSSLTYDPCPHDDIEALQKVMIHGINGSVTRRLVDTFLPQFNVTAASLTPVRNCLGERTPVARPPPAEVAPESQPDAEEHDYLISYIVPAVTLAAMILVAMIIFCLLYRRRRKGVMEVSKTLTNKGIPVIFKEEMDDGKRGSGKHPIIMGQEEEGGDPRRTLPPPRYGTSPAPTSDPLEITPLRDDMDFDHRGTGDDEFYTFRGGHNPNYNPRRSPAQQRAAREMDDMTGGSPPYQPPPPFPMEGNPHHGHGPSGGNRFMHGARPSPSPNYSKPPPYVPP